MAAARDEQSSGALFCARCGTLMDVEVAKHAVVCGMCGAARSFSELAERTVTYAGAPEVFLQRFGIEPMLPNGQRVSTLATEGARERATVDEECTSCGHRGLSFHTMQLRSADEGQTVFYECLSCKHKWSVHT